jgi:hypothetical protein
VHSIVRVPQAFFIVDDRPSSSSTYASSAHRKAVAQARSQHRAFVENTPGVEAATHPLLALDPWNWQRPFRVLDG